MPYKNRAHRLAAQRRHYRDNRATYAAKNKNARQALREEIARFKEARGCTDCRQPLPYYVLQFDHTDGSNKVANVNALLRLGTREAVLREVAKCEVVCANCHATRTFTRGTHRFKRTIMVDSSSGQDA